MADVFDVVSSFPAALPEEEEEDDVDPFEFLLKIPCFGKPIYDKLEELTQGA